MSDPECRQRVLAKCKRACRLWVGCCCVNAADGHCYICGHLKREHDGRGERP